MDKNITRIAEELTITQTQVQTVLDLLAEGATIPFIARYRKDKTKGLDEVEIKTIADRMASLTALDERKATILGKIEEQGKLTPELQSAIEAAEKMTELEELYLPYKEKKQTKASLAREAGLSPLTRLIFQGADNLKAAAEPLTSEAYPTASAAIEGAKEIAIEAISENHGLRSWLYQEVRDNSTLTSQLKDEEKDPKQVFENYYDFSESLASLPPHRLLALNRGEKLGVLRIKFDHQLDKMQRFFLARFVKKTDLLAQVVDESLKKRLLPTMERRLKSEMLEVAEEGAIELFSDNLRHLLLTAPLKGKMVLGFDPAFRTGAKLAVVDQLGDLQTTEVIYPVKPAKASEIEAAKKRLSQLIRDWKIEIIAIGNGTASRESEAFVAEVLKDFPEVAYVIVNESGASVYSASELARQEFPDLPVEKRSAISIARRLQDPLAELVKIDPQSIGVGQYQHDVSQKKLREQLDFVVETVVNQVGVNVNTASPALLSHVSGLNKTLTENIVRYRQEEGAFTSRKDLKKVPRLGAKAYEQAAGFLRIPDAANVLDRTGVHPENYSVVNKLFEKLAIVDLDVTAKSKLSSLSISEMADELGVGPLTLEDIIQDLLKPGRDLRDSFAGPQLRSDVLDIKDLKPGQKLEGVVRNVVDFGAFVDIGVHEDGLVHITQLSKNFVKHPSQVVSVGDLVTVWVLDVQVPQNRISLTMVEENGSN
ncbi:RNA-binding transcriptional accessory protein [Streptococcus sp. 121]|uniref:Tex family protein n=1 Tax=Streptococcus sp. 121 TaxID=2797637 RepID=UPI0018F0826A|nr:Tex family protein [Streptococcus sp. 121]MBJ6745916.1 RNA-binding transcriptional accessory protein [Streptococcus sp. 121]